MSDLTTRRAVYSEQERKRAIRVRYLLGILEVWAVVSMTASAVIMILGEVNK